MSCGDPTTSGIQTYPGRTGEATEEVRRRWVPPGPPMAERVQQQGCRTPGVGLRIAQDGRFLKGDFRGGVAARAS